MDKKIIMQKSSSNCTLSMRNYKITMKLINVIVYVIMNMHKLPVVI